MQQASQNPFGVNQSSRSPLGSLLMSAGGLNSSATSGLPPALLSQLEKLGGSTSSATSDSAVENLSALAGSQGLLGFGGSTQMANAGLVGGVGVAGSSSLAGSALFRQAAGAAAPNMESAGVSDALSLLARAIPRGDGSNHGFGGVPDRQDGGDRYND
jgi:hypothetical protein